MNEEEAETDSFPSSTMDHHHHHQQQHGLLRGSILRSAGPGAGAAAGTGVGGLDMPNGMNNFDNRTSSRSLPAPARQFSMKALGNSVRTLGMMNRHASSNDADGNRRMSIGTLDHPEDSSSSATNSSNSRTSREETYASLQRARDEKARRLKEVRSELEKARREHMEDAHLHQLEVNRLKLENDFMAERVKVFDRDLKDKESLHGYANLIKEAAPAGGADSSYVLRLQKQLVRAEKKMEAMQEQMEMVQKSCEQVTSSLHSELTELISERCRVELELKDQLSTLAEQKKKLEEEYSAKLEQNRVSNQGVEEEEGEGDEEDGDDAAAGNGNEG